MGELATHFQPVKPLYGEEPILTPLGVSSRVKITGCILYVCMNSRGWCIDGYFSDDLTVIQFTDTLEFLENEDAVRNKLKFEDSDKFWDSVFTKLKSIYRIKLYNELIDNGEVYEIPGTAV